jgi:hypothetical protein
LVDSVSVPLDALRAVPAGTPVTVALGYPPDDPPPSDGVVELVLALVVLLVAVGVLATAVIVGVEDAVDVLGDVLVEAVEALGVLPLVVADVVLPVAVLLVVRDGVVVGVAVTLELLADGEGSCAVENVRSTQYWLACHVLLGKALVPPYV